MRTEVQRKLTTILAADAAGYSRAMDIDEVSALNALRAARDVFSKFIERHRGRIVNTAGDGLIAEFPSVVEAVQCAIEVQNELFIHRHDNENALRFRIGIHLGDVLIDGSDLLGEGVNLASRLESMAEPGGVLISQQVYDQVQHKLSIGFEYLGARRPKNFSQDVPIYRISNSNNKREPDRTQRKAYAIHKPDAAAAPPVFSEDLRDRVIRQGKLLAGIFFILCVVDLTTGSPFWAHWPGLVLATLIALKAAPLFVRGRFGVNHIRGIVIVIALAMVNLFTWVGYPWFLWPAAVLITVELLRRLRHGGK